MRYTRAASASSKTGHTRSKSVLADLSHQPARWCHHAYKKPVTLSEIATRF
jgi:hypothetical protein